MRRAVDLVSKITVMAAFLGCLGAGTGLFFKPSPLLLRALTVSAIIFLLSAVILAGIHGPLVMVARSLRQHWVSGGITVLCVSLASGLVMAVLGIQTQAKEAFTSGATGFDAVLGARGSQLQLVLNTVFHLETSPGNIPWSLYSGIGPEGEPVGMKNRPEVAFAIPYAVGDNYKGFRIVGTTQEMFTKYTYGTGRRLEMADGKPWMNYKQDGWSAVIGHNVAIRTGLKVGDRFHSYHGLTFDSGHEHANEFTVVAILKPTNTPVDRVIWVPVECYYRMEGHQLHHGGAADAESAYTPKADDEIPDADKKISAVMVKLKNPIVGGRLSGEINSMDPTVTFAWPMGNIMIELYNKLGWVIDVLMMVAKLVMAVAAGSILAGLYNTMNERRREFAILRALGASRSILFSAIVLESTVLALLGAALGFAVYAALIAAAGYLIPSQTGLILETWHPNDGFIIAPLVMGGLGLVAGVVPAIKAYATDVASNLAPST